MKTRVLSLIAATFFGGTEIAVAQQDRAIWQRASDSLMPTGQSVMSFQEFERAVQLSAAESGISSASAALVLQDFKEANPGRVIFPSELRMRLRNSLSKNNIADSLASQMLERLSKEITSPVDTGFLEQVRTIDLADRVVYKIAPGVTPPRPIAQPLPLYTGAAREEQIEGLILMKCLVLEDGTVANCKLVRGLGYGLDESALLTIQNRWKFQPGRRDGNPVSVEANIEISMRTH